MTQKTNQFNLTTKRYSEQDLAFMMDGGNFDFYTLAVKDRFGDNGITGLAIIEKDGDEARIDTLLMSCRVLGRNIEWVFMDEVIGHLDKPWISSRFVATAKNMQVRDFYDRLGFDSIETGNEGTSYKLKSSKYNRHAHIDYIKAEIWKNN